MKIENKIIKSEPVRWKTFKFIQGKDFKELTKEAYGKLKQSLINNNFVESFKVWQNGDLYCLDGYHRCKALTELENEGYTIPETFNADFLDCKDKKEASKLVLIYSSIYAKVTDEGLYEFINANDLNFDDLKLEIDIPNVGEIDKLVLSGDQSDNFNLASGDRAPFQQMTFTLSDAQCQFIKSSLRKAELESENFGNENSNGNALYAIVYQWAGQRK